MTERIPSFKSPYERGRSKSYFTQRLNKERMGIKMIPYEHFQSESMPLCCKLHSLTSPAHRLDRHLLSIRRNPILCFEGSFPNLSYRSIVCLNTMLARRRCCRELHGQRCLQRPWILVRVDSTLPHSRLYVKIRFRSRSLKNHWLSAMWSHKSSKTAKCIAISK